MTHALNSVHVAQRCWHQNLELKSLLLFTISDGAEAPTINNNYSSSNNNNDSNNNKPCMHYICIEMYIFGVEVVHRDLKLESPLLFTIDDSAEANEPCMHYTCVEMCMYGAEVWCTGISSWRACCCSLSMTMMSHRAMYALHMY